MKGQVPKARDASKSKVPKARDVSKSISYKRETEAQEGEGPFLDLQMLLGPSSEI